MIMLIRWRDGHVPRFITIKWISFFVECDNFVGMLLVSGIAGFMHVMLGIGSRIFRLSNTILYIDLGSVMK